MHKTNFVAALRKGMTCHTPKDLWWFSLSISYRNLVYIESDEGIKVFWNIVK